MNLYLIGLPGVGKSHFGKLLAEYLSWKFIDLDSQIESSYGNSISHIFEHEGEGGFRVLEQKALTEVSSLNETVIATGGGTPCFYNNMEVMKHSGVTLYIKDDLSAIAQRLLSDRVKRPLFASKTLEDCKMDLLNLLADRRSYYEQTHIITGFGAFDHMHLLTNRLELFTKT